MTRTVGFYTSHTQPLDGWMTTKLAVRISWENGDVGFVLARAASENPLNQDVFSLPHRIADDRRVY